MQDILNQLPEGYKEACWETKAMQRRKGIQHEDILLILWLYAEFHITPECTGETHENFSFHANDLVIADRIYATISGIEHCKKSGSDFILRLPNKAFNLYDENGNRLILTEDILKKADCACQDFTVYYKSKETKLTKLRLCVRRKTKD